MVLVSSDMPCCCCGGAVVDDDASYGVLIELRSFKSWVLLLPVLVDEDSDDVDETEDDEEDELLEERLASSVPLVF